jgi:hypothetical protein
VFLKDEFIKALKMNFKKVDYCKDTKKIIFPKIILKNNHELEETEVGIEKNTF